MIFKILRVAPLKLKTRVCYWVHCIISIKNEFLDNTHTITFDHIDYEANKCFFLVVSAVRMCVYRYFLLTSFLHQP